PLPTLARITALTGQSVNSGGRPMDIANWLGRSGILLLAMVALVAGMAGCTRKPAAKSQPPPPQVEGAYPIQRSLYDSEEFTGWTKAVRTVEIRSRVTGYLVDAPQAKNGNGKNGNGKNGKKGKASLSESQVRAEEGGDVAEGDLLFRIDSSTYEAEVA